MPAGRPRKYKTDKEKYEAQKAYARTYYRNRYHNDEAFKIAERARVQEFKEQRNQRNLELMIN